MINRISDFKKDIENGRSEGDFFGAIGQRMTKRLRDMNLESLAKENPAVLLGVGVAVGIALGWWVKRK